MLLYGIFLADPKLSSKTEEDVKETEKREIEIDPEEQLENIRKKLKSVKDKKSKIVKPTPKIVNDDEGTHDDDDEALEEYYLGKDKHQERQRKMYFFIVFLYEIMLMSSF